MGVLPHMADMEGVERPIRHRRDVSTVGGMRRLTAVVVLTFTLVACTGGTDGTGGSRPGLDEIYSRIETSRDCDGLQAEFDAADRNHEATRAGSRNAEISLSYMEAADKRMRQVGCYDN